ncbi:receptor expression enhancing protein B isoform 2-T2 [Cochliomyia hominivorax]
MWIWDYIWNRKELQKKEHRRYVALIKFGIGAAIFCALYLVFGYGAQLLCNIIGVVYPAYISIHAIESSTKLDDTKWLTYWVTYGIMSIIEYFSGVLTSVIPFYWLLKCIFLVWCMLPMEQNGSYIIYNRVVRPYFLKHHQAVDSALDNVIGQAKKNISSVLKTD